jgi:hypothetical protein
MLNSAVLDVAIGMIFVFLIVSFGVTSGTELISSLLRWRATNLAVGIRRLLDDPDGDKLSRAVYQHGLIRGLHHDVTGKDDKRKPAHLPPRLFATTLIDLALTPADATTARALATVDDVRTAIQKNRAVLGAQTTQALLALAERAAGEARDVGGHLAKLQDEVEQWFDGAMGRCSGWYKRRTQLCSVVIALAICLAVNVDALRISRALANSPVLRASLVAQAEKVRASGLPAANGASANDASPEDATAAAIQRLQRDMENVNDLGIPMGWGSETSMPGWANRGDRVWLLWWLYKVGGIVLTAMAASLGAPFWFDMLQKLLGLRAAVTGQRPAAPAAATGPAEPAKAPAA